MKKMPFIRIRDKEYDSAKMDDLWRTVLWVFLIFLAFIVVVIFVGGCSVQTGFSTARHHRPINVILDHILPYRHQSDEFGQ